MFEESLVPSFLASIISWFTPTVFFLLLNLVIGTIVITSSLASSSSSNNNNNNNSTPQQHHQQHQLLRSPSVLQRLKSMNFYNFRSQESITNFDRFPQTDIQEQEEQTHFTRSPSVLQRLKSINLYSYISPHPPQETEEVIHYSTSETIATSEEEEEEEEEEEQEEEATLDEIYSKVTGVSRTKSDMEPASGVLVPKLPKKMKKSASLKSPFAHFVEDVEAVEKRRPATVREAAPKVKITEADDDEVDAKADDFINKFKNQLKLQRMNSFIRYKDLISRGSSGK